MSRTVVMWSGGLDSTIVLHKLALEARKNADPIIALSIRSHTCGPKRQFLNQTKARNNYLKFAHRIGLNIKSEEIDVGGTALPEHYGSYAVLREFQVFTAWILPFLQRGDVINFGFVGDYSIDINKIQSVFDSYSKLAEYRPAPLVKFPLEKWSSLDSFSKRFYSFSKPFYEMCLKYKIPRNCIFSCAEGNSNTNTCHCSKCRRVVNCTIPEQRIAPAKGKFSSSGRKI